MYRTMLDLHKSQVMQQREQVEIDALYKAVRAVRMKQTYWQYYSEEVARKKRWRAYRYR